MEDQKRKKIKMYIALAENAKGETLGLCEKKPYGNFHWSKHKVRLFRPWSNSSMKPVDLLKKKYKDKLLDTKLALKILKQYRNIDSRNYVIYGNSTAQYGYRYVKKVAEDTKLPKGFAYRVYRVNSKHCPVTVDLTYFWYVHHMHAKKEDVDKHAYRNPYFFEKLSHIMSDRSDSIPAGSNTTGVPGEDAGQDSPCAKASQTS